MNFYSVNSNNLEKKLIIKVILKIEENQTSN